MTDSFSIIWLDSIDSTNNEILRHTDTLDNMSVIAAIEQTAGRGQRGNAWVVEPGANITFSIFLRFGEECFKPIKATEQFIISEAVTLALTDFFSSFGIESKIKWPNDIYVKDKKIVGVLVENALSGSYLAHSVIGIGINCNQTEFPPSLLNPTSMALLTGHKFDIKKSLNQYLVYLRKYLEIMDTESGSLELLSEYMKRLYRLEECHDYTDCASGQVFRGKIKGISDSAKLLVEMPDKSIKEFAFKEISYIL